MGAKQFIKEEYGMNTFNPEKAISITLKKMAEMMESYASLRLENERSKS